MRLIRLRSVDSTNRFAKDYASKTDLKEFAVLAKHQTAGRGRVGRSFESPAGSGMYLSVCFKRTFSPEDVGLITAFTAVAVRESIQELCGLECGIKWVNDLYYSGKKLCGILAEGSIDPESRMLQNVVIGIGVNICQPKEGFTAAGKGIAGAVGDFVKLPPHFAYRLPLFIIKKLSKLEDALQSKAFLSEYRAHSTLIGGRVTVYPTTLEQGNGYGAVVLDIDEKARLVVKTDDGEVKALYSGEVSVRSTGDASHQ